MSTRAAEPRAVPAGWGSGGGPRLGRLSDIDLGLWVGTAGFAGLAALIGLIAGIDPALAIGAALGLVFALLAFTNLAAAVVVFSFLAFLEFAVPSGAAVALSKGAGLLLAMAWLARVATAHGRESTFLTAFPGITYLLLAYLGWGVLSVTWSPDASETLITVSRYLLNFTLLVIAYTAIGSRRYAIWFFIAWMAGTAFTAIYGLIDAPTTDAAQTARLESSVGDANEFAAILVAGIVLSLALAATARHAPILRLAGCVTVLLAMFSFVLTGSRSGVISLVVVIITCVLVAGRRWRPMAAVTAVAVAVTAVIFFAAFAPGSIRERIAQTVPGQVNTAAEGRTTIWQVGWRMVEDKPFHGVGLGSFQAASINYVLLPGTLGAQRRGDRHAKGRPQHLPRDARRARDRRCDPLRRHPDLPDRLRAASRRQFREGRRHADGDPLARAGRRARRDPRRGLLRLGSAEQAALALARHGSGPARPL